MSVNSEFYLARAAESAREARETKLDNVRARCLRAEAAWQALANRLLKSEAVRQRQAIEKAGTEANG